MEYTIDCSAITDAGGLHDLLAKALNLPGWYGHNLDALYDCLTELENPVHLILTGWDPHAAFAPGFEGVFADAQCDNPDFTAEYA